MYVSLVSLTYVNGMKFGAVTFEIISTFKKVPEISEFISC